MDALYIIAYLSSFSMYIPFMAILLSLAVISRKYDMFLFSTFIFVSVTTELLGFVLSIEGISNCFIFKIYTPAALFLLTVLLLNWEVKLSKNYAILIATIIAALALSFDYLYLTQEEWDTFSTVISNAFLGLLSTRILYLIVKSSTPFLSDYRFYIVLAILIYYGLNFTYSELGNGTTTPIYIHSVLNIIANLLYTVSILVFKKRSYKWN